MVIIDRDGIRTLVKEFLDDAIFEDEASYMNLCNRVLKSIVEPNTDGLTDEEWDKAQVFIDEALSECKTKIGELLT